MTDPQEVTAVRALVEAADRHQSDVAEFVALHHPDLVLVNLAGAASWGGRRCARR